jgi:hypothetical protein
MIQTITDLVRDLNNMLLEDPITAALWRGSMQWGDIPGILDVRPRSESICSNSTASSDEPDLLALCKPATRTRVCFAERPIVKEYIKGEPMSAIVVPPFTVGIKTIITRNLPRDITVQQLRTVFEKYGPVRDIYIPKNADRSSPYFGTIKGFALIKFLEATQSAAAYQSEYGRLTIGKNNITVEFAKEDR